MPRTVIVDAELGGTIVSIWAVLADVRRVRA